MSEGLRVLVADGDAETARWLAAVLGEGYAVATAPEGPVDVRVVGPDGFDGLRMDGPPVVLVGAPPEAAAPEGVYFAIDRRTSPAELRALIDSAAGRRPAQPPAPRAAIASRAEAAAVQRVIELTRPLALQKQLRAAAGVMRSAVQALIDADRAYCLFFDADEGDLWSEDPDDDINGRAARGLSAFAARTGLPAATSYALGDARYFAAVDDPKGSGDERLLAQPVAGGDGEVHAVIVAVREGGRADFGDEDAARLRSLASHAGPLLHQLALQLQATSVLAEDANERELFRREAVEAAASQGKQGDVIRVSPAWVQWAYWLVVALVGAGAAYLALGRIATYSEGPAVIRVAGRTEVNANADGALTDLYVSPGQPVAEGDLLARLYDAGESADYERALREFERQLRNRMLNPGDAATAQAVQALREKRDAAQARLAEREVRAPRAGIVSDVRVRPGQQVEPGAPILSLVSGDAELTVLAFLPGADRPRLAPGMTLRLELHNYRYAYQQLVIESVDADVIGPAEAQRALGPSLAGAVPITGPVVLVRARLPSDTFEADGETYRFFDGMPATAEVRVASKRIIYAVVPGLERL